MNPLFSIIITHYYKSATSSELVGLLANIEANIANYIELKDLVEVLIYHDGPNPDSHGIIDSLKYFPTLNVSYKETSKRYDDFGYSLREMGLMKASGEYIINTNSDNVLYNNALFLIKKEIEREYPKNEGEELINNNLIMFPIKMVGDFYYGNSIFSVRKEYMGKRLFTDFGIILSGFPVKESYVDLMQMVIKKSFFDKSGGWLYKESLADGKMYNRIFENNGETLRYIPEILGEHH